MVYFRLVMCEDARLTAATAATKITPHCTLSKPSPTHTTIQFLLVSTLQLGTPSMKYPHNEVQCSPFLRITSGMARLILISGWFSFPVSLYADYTVMLSSKQAILILTSGVLLSRGFHKMPLVFTNTYISEITFFPASANIA